jgi:hypothetical protein
MTNAFNAIGQLGAIQQIAVGDFSKRAQSKGKSAQNN